MLNKKTEHPPLEMGKCPKCGASESEGFDYSGHVEYEDDYYTTDFSCSRCGNGFEEDTLRLSDLEALYKKAV